MEKKKVLKITTVWLVLLGFGFGLAQAQEADTSKSADTTQVQVPPAPYEMPPVVVTATRTTHLFSEAQGNVSLVTQEEIKNSKPATVKDMLVGVETGNLGSYGGFGALENFGLRGAQSGQTLILLDGRPVADPQLGELDLNALAAANVERIEVVRGGASALWGPNAVGGVVNLITKSGQGDKVYSKLGAENGSYGKAVRAFEIGGPLWRRLDFYVTGEGRLSKGYRVNSDYDGKNLSGKLGYRLAKDWRMEASGQRYFADLGVPGSTYSYFPSTSARESDRRAEGDVKLTGAFAPEAELRLTGYGRQIRYSYIDTNSYAPVVSGGRTEVAGGEAQQSLRWRDMHLLTLGVRAQTSRGVGNSIGTHSVNEGGGFLEDEVDLLPFGILKFVPSVGVHHNSAYGTRVLPGGSLKLLHFYYSWQTAFRAPSLNDLYWSDPWMPGNPNLAPEEAISWELGYRMGVWRWFQVKGNYFRRGVRDLILWAQNANGVYTPSNIGRTRTSGFELSGEMKTGIGLSAKANWSGISARDITNGATLTLPYQPARSGTGYLEYQKEFWLYPKGKAQTGGKKGNIMVGARLSGEYVGSRYEKSDNTVSLPKYGLGSFLLTLRVVDLTGYYGVDNFGKVKYESRRGYPMPGKTYRAGIGVELWD
jgi:outer membrane cobalamin receptor